ncbi:hypothetical protein CU097_013835, partial [Rhizopus azygosporus]
MFEAMIQEKMSDSKHHSLCRKKKHGGISLVDVDNKNMALHMEYSHLFGRHPTLQHFCKLLQKLPTLPVSELWSPRWYLNLSLRCVVQPIAPADQDAMSKNVPLR